MNAAKAPIDIAPVTFHADGSGAPTTVTCAGYVYAVDWLDGYRATLIRPASGSRVQSKVAARRVEHAYTAYVQANAPDGWLALNAALYAD